VSQIFIPVPIHMPSHFSQHSVIIVLTIEKDNPKQS